MPELDLSGKEVPNWKDSFKVSALMHYPNDHSAREQYWIMHEVARVLHSSTREEEIVPFLVELLAPIGGFRAVILDGPSYADIKHQAELCMHHGISAGDTLANILRMEQSGFGGSVTKARKAMEQFFPKWEQSGLQPQLPGKFPTKRSALLDAWTKFKSVAHFWAALHTGDSQGRQLSPFPPENLPVFLAMAELYRHFGEHHYPPRKKVPTLLAEETWRVVHNFPTPDLRVSFPLLTADRMKAAGL
jgi:hypothetical protein